MVGMVLAVGIFKLYVNSKRIFLPRKYQGNACLYNQPLFFGCDCMVSVKLRSGKMEHNTVLMKNLLQAPRFQTSGSDPVIRSK